MLGNFSGADRLMNEGEMRPPQPRCNRLIVTVRVTFEESRLAASCLTTAYEQVLPRRRRAVGGAARPAAAQDQALPRSVERTGT